MFFHSLSFSLIQNDNPDYLIHLSFIRKKYYYSHRICQNDLVFRTWWLGECQTEGGGGGGGGVMSQETLYYTLIKKRNENDSIIHKWIGVFFFDGIIKGCVFFRLELLRKKLLIGWQGWINPLGACLCQILGFIWKVILSYFNTEKNGAEGEFRESFLNLWSVAYVCFMSWN